MEECDWKMGSQRRLTTHWGRKRNDKSLSKDPGQDLSANGIAEGGMNKTAMKLNVGNVEIHPKTEPIFHQIRGAQPLSYKQCLNHFSIKKRTPPPKSNGLGFQWLSDQSSARSKNRTMLTVLCNSFPEVFRGWHSGVFRTNICGASETNHHSLIG